MVLKPKTAKFTASEVEHIKAIFFYLCPHQRNFVVPGLRRESPAGGDRLHA